MKPIEIAEQYETTHFDGDALLGQSETNDGVLGIVWVIALGLKEINVARFRIIKSVIFLMT